MKLDEVKRHIQSFFDVDTLTIVGSGLSDAEGIPGMGALATQLIQDMPKTISKDSLEQWKSIEKDLNDGIDLESVLQKNKANEEIEKNIINITNKLISCKDAEIFKELLKGKKELRFSKYLSKFNTSIYNSTVITTNYDLLIEYACEFINLPYIDSFVGKIIGEFSPEEAKKEMINGVVKGRQPRNTYCSHIKIYKPHGSINWKFIDGTRLYRIQNIESNFGYPCIITPGTNKYEKGYDIPFGYHIAKMGDEIDSSKRMVFIGYGFNDNHLETHLKKLNNISKPKLILTRTLSENAKAIINENVMAIEFYIENQMQGSRVYWGKEIEEFKRINLWDINGLLEEVF